MQPSSTILRPIWMSLTSIGPVTMNEWLLMRRMDPQWAEELKAFMNAYNPIAAEALVNALNHWQRMVFEIFVADFQRLQPKDVPDISTHCRASIAGSQPQLCTILIGVAGTGRSHVVRLLIAKLRACGFSILVCGASGVAALNVGGRTIHSLFSLSRTLIGKSKKEQYFGG